MNVSISASISGVDRSMNELRRLKRELPGAVAPALKSGGDSILAASNAIIARRTGALAATGRVDTWNQGDTYGVTVSYGAGIRYAVYAMFQRRNYKRTPPGEAYALYKAADRLRMGIELNIRLAVDAAIARITSG